MAVERGQTALTALTALTRGLRVGRVVCQRAGRACALQGIEELAAKDLGQVTVGVASLLLVDGAFSGVTLTSGGFASLFSPKAAIWAGCAFSVATSWLLWQLVKDAARENVIAQRRAVIRNLRRSDNPSDQEAAKGMQRRIGLVLGHDYGASNPIRARLMLSAVVVLLAASTFVMRVINEADPAPVSTTTDEASANDPNVKVMLVQVYPAQRLE